MRSLNSQDVIRIWEEGRKQHTVDRALTVLSVAQPGVQREQLADLSVGERDSHLLAIREQLFNKNLVAVTSCPNCREVLELSLTTCAIKTDCATEEVAKFSLSARKVAVHCRVPTSKDLAAIATCGDSGSARAMLIDRCVGVHAGFVNALPVVEREQFVQELAEEIERRDPQSDIQLSLNCAECKYTWNAKFDIESFLWREICDFAKRLLHEVHILASAYGWREEEILAMSPLRRNHYIEMVA